MEHYPIPTVDESKDIEPTAERVRAVTEAREPENASEVRRCLLGATAQLEKHSHVSGECVRFVEVNATPKGTDYQRGNGSLSQRPRAERGTSTQLRADILRTVKLMAQVNECVYYV